MLTLKEIKCILREYDFHPAKRLGQNFLTDRNIQKKMIEALDAGKEDTVLEIGPGMGALTGELCKRAKKVVAVEKDRRLYEFLSKNREFDNLELIHGDILKYEFNNKEKIKVVGNLPYYISSPILIRLLRNKDFIKEIFITTQKEFAERLIAVPGKKDYGSISCFTQFHAEPDILFSVKKSAFYPVPKVDSAFLKIVIRDKDVYLTDEDKLFKIIRAGFEKRRKTILNSLYSSGICPSKENLSEKLKAVSIDPERRPETMTLSEFIKLAEIL
jgi:16S rRNA (adenine1518-N6/adenine1519-N6)-dimethyltransferase